MSYPPPAMRLVRLASPLLVLLSACASEDEGDSPFGSTFTTANDEVDGDTTEGGSTTESSSSTDSSTDSDTDSSTTSGSTTEDPTTGGGGGTPCATDNDPKQLLGCGDQIEQSFAGLFGDLDAGCGQAFPFQDSIYHFIPPVGGATVTASFAVQGNDPGDGAILVLEGACSEGSCVASSQDMPPHTSVTFEAIDGVDYWFVYEAPSQQPTYAISIACQ